MKDKKLIFGIALAFVFLASFSFSYAYFSNSIVNKDVRDQVVETGTLSLRYVDGAEIAMNNIKPDDTFTKTIYVANTSTMEVTYNLIWQELVNEIENNEMVLSATCTRMNGTTEEEDGACNDIEDMPIYDTTIKKKIVIEPNIVHKYDLTITFLELNDNQNYNQGKKFNGVLGVKEYTLSQFEKDSWATIVNNVKTNNIGDYKVGDTKEIDLGDLGKHNIRIANTTTPSECSTTGFSQTACGFAIEFEDGITTHVMNSTRTNVGGWPASEIYSYLNTDLYNMLPTDLKRTIIDTTIVSSYGSSDSNNFTSTDKLYLLASKEIYSGFSSTYDTAKKFN